MLVVWWTILLTAFLVSACSLRIELTRLFNESPNRGCLESERYLYMRAFCVSLQIRRWLHADGLLGQN
jgi:hypothetical protein